MQTPDDLAEFLAKRAQEEWEATQSPYLLSRVSPELRDQGVEYRDLITPIASLKQFAATLDNRVKVVQHPIQKAKVGLIPVSENYSFAPQNSPSASNIMEPSSRLRAANPKYAVLNFLEVLSRLDDSEIDKVEIPVRILVRMMYKK